MPQVLYFLLSLYITCLLKVTRSQQAIRHLKTDRFWNIKSSSSSYIVSQSFHYWIRWLSLGFHPKKLSLVMDDLFLIFLYLFLIILWNRCFNTSLICSLSCSLYFGVSQVISLGFLLDLWDSRNIWGLTRCVCVCIKSIDLHWNIVIF
jgi:hypothetical protein